MSSARTRTRPGQRQSRLGLGAVRAMRSTTWRRPSAARARSHRCRTHDVRAGQLRALPAQDLQRGVHHRWRAQPTSLFAMIRNTYARDPAACSRPIATTPPSSRAAPGRASFRIRDAASTRPSTSRVDILMKVETHNHPTAISPVSRRRHRRRRRNPRRGRDGVGAKPKAGLRGFSVSNLKIPGFEQPWEAELRQARRASPRRSTS